MRFSVVASVSRTRFGELAFSENLETSASQIKSLGYDGIELALQDPASFDAKGCNDLISSLGLQVSAIGTGQIFVDRGLNLSDPDPKVRTAAIDELRRVQDIALIMEAPIILGCIAGTETDRAEAWKRISDSLCEAVGKLPSSSLRYVIEPLHRYHHTIFNRLADVHNFISGHLPGEVQPTFAILADTWHMNIEERSIAASFADYSHEIGHVHFADSNRRAPGMGHIDFRAVVEQLAICGYDEYISFEIVPDPDSVTAARTALRYTRAIETQTLIELEAKQNTSKRNGTP